MRRRTGAWRGCFPWAASRTGPRSAPRSNRSARARTIPAISRARSSPVRTARSCRSSAGRFTIAEGNLVLIHKAITLRGAGPGATILTRKGGATLGSDQPGKNPSPMIILGPQRYNNTTTATSLTADVKHGGDSVARGEHAGLYRRPDCSARRGVGCGLAARYRGTRQHLGVAGLSRGVAEARPGAAIHRRLCGGPIPGPARECRVLVLQLRPSDGRDAPHRGHFRKHDHIRLACNDFLPDEPQRPALLFPDPAHRAGRPGAD